MRSRQPGYPDDPREAEEPFLPPEEEPKREKAVVVSAILVSLVFFAVLGLLLYRSFHTADAKTAVPSTVPDLSATLEPLDTPKSIPAPTPSPTAGISSAGTEVQDLVYTESGKVASLRELLDGEWVDWVYVYDENDNFRYRYRNIGSVPSELTSRVMPGTDTTYSENAYEVENCIGFTLEFQVYQIIRGDGMGPRTLRLRSEGDWIIIGQFTYPRSNVYDLDSFEFRFDEPISFDAFGAHRVYADDSQFKNSQELTGVLVADYHYVSLG